MTQTPDLRPCIRNFRTSAYTSIFEICPDETRLYGTESLYGDWDGELLLLAKDFAPSKFVKDRKHAGCTRPYHHTDWAAAPKAVGAPTNRNLWELSSPLACGKLYGSILACLLRDDGNTSGPLPDRQAIDKFVCETLRWTIGHMRNLRAVACVGEDAWHWAAKCFGHAGGDWSDHRDNHRPLNLGGWQLFALHHTSRFSHGGRRARQEDWAWMAREAGIEHKGYGRPDDATSPPSPCAVCRRES
jgi:hypothetical protein